MPCHVSRPSCWLVVLQVRLEEDPRSLWGRFCRRVGLRSPEHMVLLDVGMVAELTQQDQKHLLQFFKVRQ